MLVIMETMVKYNPLNRHVGSPLLCSIPFSEDGSPERWQRQIEEFAGNGRKGAGIREEDIFKWQLKSPFNMASMACSAVTASGMIRFKRTTNFRFLTP